MGKSYCCISFFVGYILIRGNKKVQISRQSSQSVLYIHSRLPRLSITSCLFDQNIKTRWFQLAVCCYLQYKLGIVSPANCREVGLIKRITIFHSAVLPALWLGLVFLRQVRQAKLDCLPFPVPFTHTGKWRSHHGSQQNSCDNWAGK